MHKIIKFFDRLEDKIRKKLSRKPIFYALLGSIGMILLYRGLWKIADDLNLSALLSTILGLVILLAIGLFVSIFVGEQIIISGIKEEKRIDEKTEEEIRKEENALEEIRRDISEIKKEIDTSHHHSKKN